MAEEDSVESIMDNLKDIKDSLRDLSKAIIEMRQRQQQNAISASQHQETMKQQADLMKEQMEGIKEALTEALKEVGIDASKQQQQEEPEIGGPEIGGPDGSLQQDTQNLDDLAKREHGLLNQMDKLDSRMTKLTEQRDIAKSMAKVPGQDPVKLQGVLDSFENDLKGIEQDRMKLQKDIDSVVKQRNKILTDQKKDIADQKIRNADADFREKVQSIDKEQNTLLKQNTANLSPDDKKARDTSIMENQRKKAELSVQNDDLKRQFRVGSVGETMEKQGYKFGQKPSIGTGVRVK